MRLPLLSALLASALALSACGQDAPVADPQAAVDARAVRITTARAELSPVALTDSAVGWIEAKSSPQLTAEVDGRALEVLVDAGTAIRKGQLLARIDPTPYRLARDAAAADLARLEALAENGRRQVERQRKMLAQNFVTQSAVDQAEAELSALEEQHKAARARLSSVERDLANTEVKAPVDGILDLRLVSTGDFVQKGKPLFRLVTQDRLRVHLPFPETLAGQLAVGLPVDLSTPTSAATVSGKIQELRPAAAAGSRAIEAILEIDNPGDWRPGASVRGRVTLDSRQGVVVPEVAVVDRPAGRTVYTVADGKVSARLVKTGLVQDGRIEITEGLASGTAVAVDGAGFLTDGAAVKVLENAQ